MRNCYRQAQHRIRFDWGESGLRAIGHDADVVVIVDVLSFSTAVEIAVSRGAEVMPVRWSASEAAATAACTGSLLAVPRAAMGPAAPYSLSPVSLLALPPMSRLVLPSPNGAACAAAAAEMGARCVIAGSLRNASAVASAARLHGDVIAVVAAGEHWSDGTLRPALEDQLGAGAILSALDPALMSPEANVATLAYRSVTSLAETLLSCVSAVELIEDGYRGDVDVAFQVNVGSDVPVLGRDGFFRSFRATD